MKNIIILLAFIPFSLNAENIPIKDSLASLVEKAVVETNLNINISSQTYNTININKVNGIGVCEPKAKANVLKLQKSLFSNVKARRVYSMYELNIRNSDNGKVLYLNDSNPEFKKTIKGCINVFVSVD